MQRNFLLTWELHHLCNVKLHYSCLRWQGFRKWSVTCHEIMKKQEKACNLFMGLIHQPSSEGSPVFLVHWMFLLCIISDVLSAAWFYFMYLFMFIFSIVYLHRLLDLVVRPVPSTSAAQGGSWQSPCGASTSFTASSPLKSNMLGCTSQKNFSRASELNLLETPLVVKVCVLKNRINQPNQKPVNFV